MSNDGGAGGDLITSYRQLLDRLSARGVRHSLLRDADVDTAAPADLDLLVWPEDRADFTSTSGSCGFRLVRRLWGGRKEVLAAFDGCRLLLLDVHYALVQDGLDYLPLDGIDTRLRRTDSGANALGPEDQLLHLFFHSLIGKRGLQAKHLPLVRALLAGPLDRSLLEPRIGQLEVRSVFSRFAADPDAFTIGREAAAQGSAGVREALTGDLPGRLSRVIPGRPDWRRRGVHVAFMGVDGAGKSTIIDATRAQLAKACTLPVRTVYMGPWGQIRSPFMRLYKGLGLGLSDEDWPGRLRDALRRRRPGEALQAASKTATSSVQGWLYYVAISLELWYRYLREVRPVVRRGGVVLSDRYVYDLRHIYKTRPATRFALSRRLVCRLFPAPDRVFFVQNEPEVIASRKAQLSADAVERYQGLYREALAGCDTVPVVTDRPADDLAREIVASIMERYLAG